MSSLAADRVEARPARRAVAALLTAAVVGALVVAGRFEGERRADAEIQGMARTLRAVGALDADSLSAYRVLPAFDCLLYRRGSNTFALEVCVDDAGRVVETIDRRGERQFHSLRDDPGASTLRVDRSEVDRLLRKMGAPCC